MAASVVTNPKLSKRPDLSLLAAKRRAIVAALRYTKGNHTRAAKTLEIGRTTLYRKIQELKIQDDEWMEF